MMTNGVTYDFKKETPEEERSQDIKLALARGKHKQATNNLELLESLVVGDSKSGFQVPIFISSVKKIKYGISAPFGIAN